jgi:tripartite-type tricarboxylate transporter receptor subunit TctC
MRSLSCVILALAAMLAWNAPARAQADYPNQPIKIIVPYPPGGATDITLRAYANFVQQELGQPIIVDYRPGAGTNIGAGYAARQEPDGYTLYVANFASHAINRWLYKDLTYDPLTDFTQIAMMVRSPIFACTKPNSPITTMAQLIAAAKANPGKLSYGSTGFGSPNHTSGELFKNLAKVDLLHVPYKGAAPLVVGLLGGEIDVAFDASVITHHRAGTLKCLGVSSDFRWPTDKDIPSIADTVPGYNLVSFFGIVGPAKMPDAIVQKINKAFRNAAARPEVAKALEVTGVIPFPATVQETKEFLTEQNSKWRPIIEASGAKM